MLITNEVNLNLYSNQSRLLSILLDFVQADWRQKKEAQEQSQPKIFFAKNIVFSGYNFFFYRLSTSTKY